MEIDLEEYTKQRKESILKSGEYCLVELLIGVEDKTPMADITVKRVSPVEVAMMIVSLKKCAESLEERYPIAYELSKDLDADSEEIES